MADYNFVFLHSSKPEPEQLLRTLQSACLPQS